MLTETHYILLVEDNSADACLVQEMLEEVKAPQFQVIHVSRLADALICLATKSSISVILLDLSLPDVQGLDTVKQLLLAAPDIPVIVMSNLCDEAIALQALQQGFRITSSNVIPILTSWCDRSAMPLSGNGCSSKKLR
jgi:CheY-like chemotaxis protein